MCHKCVKVGKKERKNAVFVDVCWQDYSDKLRVNFNDILWTDAALREEANHSFDVFGSTHFKRSHYR